MDGGDEGDGVATEFRHVAQRNVCVLLTST